MWNEEPPEEFEENLLQFIKNSVSEIHRTQNAQAYMEWVKKHSLTFLPPSDDSLQFALLFAQTIWNAFPLKNNRYRPSPLPELKRNSPCFCNSGKKYKQCCIQFSGFVPPIDTGIIWSFLIEEMGTSEIKDALALQALPLSSLILLAEGYMENRMLGDAIDILEIVFSLPIDKMGEEESIAVTLLCNAYDSFKLPEFKKRKMDLLHRLKDQGSLWLRSEAWQRLSVIALDKGDKKAAWDAFQKAQRLTPNSVGIDLLEINLLLGERKDDLAQQRAKIILKKMRRNGDYENAPFIDFLESVAENAQKVSEQMFSGQGDNSDQIDRLTNCLELVASRRLPTYKLESFTADYHWMQEGQEDIKAEDAIQTDLFGKPEEENNEDEDVLFNQLPEKEYRLITPKNIEKLEQRWETLFDKWEAESFPWDASDWLNFLEKNSACFGSLTIIADILNGLEEWQQEEHLLQNLSLPLAQRAWKIYENLPEQGGMPWAFLENRPLYSALYSIVQTLTYLGQEDEAMHYAQRLILMNPSDNHALREQLVNYYLAQKDYDKAQALSDLYSQDILLGMNMAKVLMPLVLGDEKTALAQWEKVQKSNKHIKRYMVSNSIKAPQEVNAYGVTMGGKDEAWLYREEARYIWLDHKGVITWLKKH